MHQTPILRIIIIVVVVSISVDGLGISQLRSVAVRNQNDIPSFLLSPSLSVSSRYATKIDTIDERNNPTTSDNNQEQIDDTIQELLDTARRLGPVGVRNTPEDQKINSKYCDKVEATAKAR